MFRTELTIAPQERQLSRTARVLTVGSCFADSIGERLRLNKVTTLVNPFGTVFQPLAVAQLLRAAGGEEQDWQQHVVEARGRWQSYDFHSTIGADSPVELLQTIQETVHRVGEFLRTADTVVMTLGTAWVYRLRETGELVSNLHKLPAALFEKELLTADEIVNSLAEVHAVLRRANPNVHIALTVSPVRHSKDTLPLNAVSKSVLRVACHYLSELLPGVSYFPAYELLTDELRDYRFYAADMLHPSEVAEDYIWEKFARAYFDADFGRFRKEWAAVRQSLGHRPLHPGAPEHRVFLDQTRERLERMASQGVDVRQELRDVQRQLAALPPPRLVKVPEVTPEDEEERIDIGEAAIPIDDARPATPSEPRSERRQDNRRDGRRNERSNQDRRPSRVVQPTPVPEEVIYTNEEPAEVAALATDAPSVRVAVEPEPLVTEETAFPAKKKKRRSRGGAKRTARKHAAQLAATQQGAPPSSLAAEELVEELAQETAALTPELADPAPALAETTPPEVTPIHETDRGADSTPILALPPRKGGTGPTPKKSKVITKSGLVKRTNRASLYRSPAPEPSEAASSALAELPAAAPIVSPPIIPEVLLERPAADTAFLPQAESAEVAAPPQEAKPKRGRSKAVARPKAKPTPSATTTAEQPAATEAAAPAVKSTKTPARAAKSAKPTATKKAAAKPAAPRRSRAAGKATPPPDAPAS